MADLNYDNREKQIRSGIEHYWISRGVEGEICGLKWEVWESVRKTPEAWQRVADFLRETKQKKSVADFWQRKANSFQMERALSENAEGQFQTGLSYTCGAGLEEDLGKGFYWFLRAARGNKNGAKEVLADFCRTGTAFPQDIDLAKQLEGVEAIPAWKGSEKEERLASLIAEREELLLQEQVLRGKLELSEFTEPEKPREIRKPQTKASKTKKADKTDRALEGPLSWAPLLAPVLMIALTIYTVSEYAGNAAAAPGWLYWLISIFYYLPLKVLFHMQGPFSEAFGETAYFLLFSNKVLDLIAHMATVNK